MTGWLRAALLAACALVALAPRPLRAEPLCEALAQAGADVPLDPGEAKQHGDAFERSNAQQWRSAEAAQRYLAAPEPAGRAVRAPAALDAALARILVQVEQSAALGATPVGARLAEELRALRALVRAQLGAEAVDLGTLAEDGALLARFEPGSGTWSCDDRAYVSQTVFFGGEARVPVVLAATESRRAREEDEFDLDRRGKRRHFVTLAAAVEFRAAAEATTAAFRSALARSLRQTELRLTAVDEGWDNLLAHGYSQYPWEALVNSLREIRWYDPPRFQLVVLHPEPAVVVDLRSTRRAALSGSLLVHALGGVGYFGDRRSWFLGASATGAVTTDAHHGLGGGGTLHAGYAGLRARVPHISVAVLAFRGDGGRHAPFIGVSTDLWRVFDADGNEPIFRPRAPP